MSSLQQMSARIDFSSSSDEEVGAAEEDEQLKGFVREIRTNYTALVQEHVSDSKATFWLLDNITFYFSDVFPPGAKKEHVFRECCYKIHMSRIDLETDLDLVDFQQRSDYREICAFLKYFEEQHLIPEWREYKATRWDDPREYKATGLDDPREGDML